MNPVPFTVSGETLCLSPHRFIFWESQSALIVSDLHIGKTGHFRKAGLPVPAAMFKEDLQRLFAGIQFFGAKQVIIVGDLFHSDHNKELDVFIRWRESLPHVKFTLVMGNHDILKTTFYEQSSIIPAHGIFSLSTFAFSHDKPTEKQLNTFGKPLPYCFTGHIHPGIAIYGAGRQSLRFPCFWFGKEYAVLPAFGTFTGSYMMTKSGASSIFAVVENRVIRVT